jgi:hypothetical protein
VAIGFSYIVTLLSLIKELLNDTRRFEGSSNLIILSYRPLQLPLGLGLLTSGRLRKKTFAF